MENRDFDRIILLCRMETGQRNRASNAPRVSPGQPKNSEKSPSDARVDVDPKHRESSAARSFLEEEEEGGTLELRYSHSRLSKTLSEILADKGALGYFIQFMESRGRLALIKFWMEVECVCRSYTRDEESPDGQNRNCERPEGEEASGCSEKKPKEIKEGLGGFHPPNSNEIRSNLNEPKTCGRSAARERQLVSTSKQDASRIYRKYIASDSLPVDIVSTEVKAQIERSLSCENVETLIGCLASVQRLVYEVLEEEYINDFLRSDFHCKHQIDVLTSGDVKLADILYNETAFFYFMEFMELENKRELLDFWMTAVNYKQNLMEKRSGLDPSEAQTDALIIYDKYFSLQATMPLGFSDRIRFQVEQNICREGGDGPQPDCFDRACVIVYNFLSKLYYKYLSELIGTIESGACTGLPHPRVRRAGSDCSSELSSLSVGAQETTPTTTTAPMESSPTNRFTDNDNRKNNNEAISIDTRQLYDPDSLWRRTKSTLSVGYVDDMGRFVTEIEPDPRRKYESRLSRAVKRFIHIEQDKAKEELAWKIAEMIVREITSLTLGGQDVTT